MEKKNKMSFFKRLKTAIFNLDEYGIFIEEKFSVAVKYMFLILLFISLIISFVTTYQFSKQIKKGINYIENEFPDFRFEDNKLKLDNYVEGYDKEYDFLLIADATQDIDESKINEYIQKTKNTENSLIVLNDKIIYRLLDSSVEYKYDDLNVALKINNSNKQEIIQEYYSMGGTSSISTMYMIIMSISLLIGNIIEVFADCLLVSIVGFLVARICGIRIRASIAGTLSIYSLTVPVICSFIYSIVYNLFGFEIKYFQAMYLMIAYVYIIAAILIIKTDLIKQAQELMKIKITEEKVKDEIEQQEKNKDEKQEDDDTEKSDDNKNDNKSDVPKPELKEQNKEPDGSEI